TTALTTPLLLRLMRGTELEPYVLRSGFVRRPAEGPVSAAGGGAGFSGFARPRRGGGRGRGRRGGGGRWGGEGGTRVRGGGGRRVGGGWKESRSGGGRARRARQRETDRHAGRAAGRTSWAGSIGEGW